LAANAEVATLLLDAGADVNARDLVSEARSRHTHKPAAGMDSMAAPPAESRLTARRTWPHLLRCNWTRHVSQMGFVPLMWACLAGKLELVQALLRAGAELRARQSVRAAGDVSWVVVFYLFELLFEYLQACVVFTGLKERKNDLRPSPGVR
jgi:hypothetical protein